MLALGDQGVLVRLLAALAWVLRKIDPVAARRKRPAAFQTLEHPPDNGPRAAPPGPTSHHTTPPSSS